MKIPIFFALSLAVLACYAEAKSVLAHFMVGNTAHYNQALWEDEMRLAAGSGIDAFALNIANGEEHNNAQLKLAFQAAAARNFKLLFSFDYAGGVSPWTKETVLNLLTTYATQSTYVRHNGLPLVSTFEGPDFADDWIWIKSSFKVFFVPDWSSKGAKIAVGLGNGVADGLFNWAAWPDQPNWPKETYIDASYKVALKGKPYMMPVSPWFYTNMPGFDKNWMWRGEMLWYDRWVQTLHVQPEWVQIISWNDYGESHYIAPIRGDASLIAFGDKYGKAPFNYARGIEHGAWRIFLPHLTALYKTGTATVTQEGLNVWYRMHPKSAGCKDGGTTAYTATHMQVERPWTEGNRDGVFFAAMLGSSASAHVTIGGTVFNPSWRYFPEGGVGVYVGWVETQATGTVKVEIRRGANVVVSLTGERPIGGCQDGYFNFNPVVYAAMGPTIAPKSPPLVINKDTPCVAGNGIGDFQDLCQNACKFNYCPIEACMCTRWGKEQGTDIVRGPPGYPAAGRDTNFEGLCAVTCSYGSAGICPSSKCGMVKLQPIVSSVSPFTAKSCTSGHALPAAAAHDQAARDQICAFGCKYGYCPTEICVCDSVGVLILPQNVGVQYTGDKPSFRSGSVGIRLLCRYTCGWGVCPAPVCKFPWQVLAPASPDGGCRLGTGPGNYEGLCHFSCRLGYCPSPCTCTSRSGPANTRPTLVAKKGYAVKGMSMDYANLCSFVVRHGFTPLGACTEDFAQASDFYFGSPTLDYTFTAPNMRRGMDLVEQNGTDSVALLSRQLQDHDADLATYYRMWGDNFKNNYCEPNCEDCSENEWYWRGQPWLCMGAHNPADYCKYIGRANTLEEKFADLNGGSAMIWILAFVGVANAEEDPAKGALGSFYKDQFLRTLTAMWGGRNRYESGPMVQGDSWGCGKRGKLVNCGLSLDQVMDMCEHSNIPGFGLLAIQMQFINEFYNSLYDAFEQARADLRDEAKTIMDHFDPTDDSLAKMFTTIVGIMSVIALASFTGGAFAGLATVAATTGAIGGALGGGLAIYDKFSTSDFEKKIENADQAIERINAIVAFLRDRVTHTAEVMFTGTPEGTYTLLEHTKYGLFLQSRADANAAVKSISETIRGQLIPQIWKSSNGVYPVVVFLPNIHGLNKVTIWDRTRDISRIFPYRHDFKSKNGSDFSGFLFDAGEYWSDRYEYKKLQGFDEMEDKGGISKQRIIESSFDAWERSINGPDWKITAEWLAENPHLAGADTPGIYGIPTCHFELMDKALYTNTNEDGVKKCSTWPCCNEF